MGTQVIDVAADFGDWITNLRKDGKVIDSFKEKVDKVANALRPIANFLGTIIPGAVQKFKDSNLIGALEYVFDEALGAFDKTLKNGGILTVLGDSIGSLGETLSKWSGIDITWLTSFLSEDLKQIDEFLPNLQPLLDFIKSLGETFSDNFSSTGGGLAGLLSGVFNAISDGLQAVADTGLLSSIGEGIKEFGEHLKEVTGIDLTWFTDFADKALSKIEEKIPALQPLLDFFANLGKNFKETSDANGGGLKGGIAATFDSITSGLTALSDTFTGLTGVDFSNAVGVVNDILTGFGGILSFVAGAVTDLWNGLKSLIDWFKTTDFSGFTSIFEGIGPLLTDLWEFIKTVLNDVITSLSTNGNAIGPMALLQNILIFFTALGGIKIMGILSNVKEIFGTVNDILSGFSTSTTSNFEVMAKGILMLAGAIVLLSTVDSNKFTEIGIALVGLIAMVEFAIAGLGKIAESFMAPKAISTGKKSFLDKILGHFLPEDTTGIKNMANSVLKIAGALLILATAVKILSSIEKNFGAALGAMTLMLGEIVGVMYLMALIGKKKGQLVSGASGIVAISVAMLILSSAIKKLAEIGDIPSVFASAFIIGVLTAALVGLVNSMSDSARSAIAAFAMIEIATALLILTGVLAIVANLQEQHDMFNVLLNTAGALLILAGGLMVISQIPSAKVIAAAAAMLIMSIALLALMPALLVMDNLKDPNTTLITMAEALIALAGALVIMSLVPAPGLLAASAAMVIMAAAMLILSVAVNLFGTPNAVTAIENLVSMLGIIIVLGIEGLVASAGIVILAGAIALLGVSIVVLGAGLAIIASVSDALIQLALTVYTVVKSLKTSEFGKHLLDGLFGGISLTDIWNKVKSIGQSIVNKFKEFFGIHSPSLLMEQEIGEELMPGIANGIENTSFLVDGAIDDWGGDALTLFESWMSEMGDTGETVMPDIAGYFDAGSYDVFSSIDGFGTDALGDMNGWMDLLGGSGDDVMSNLANGIDMKSYLLNDSINGMGDSAVGTMSSTLSRLSDAVNEDLVTEPVITPVLDLSKVKEGVATINELFGKVQLDKLNKFSGSSSSNKSSNVTYVQNNYSPKALSRTEIYRQTKVLVKG